MKKNFALFLAILPTLFFSHQMHSSKNNKTKSKRHSLSLLTLNGVTPKKNASLQFARLYKPIEKKKKLTFLQAADKKSVNTFEKNKPSTYWSPTDLGLVALAAYVSTFGERCYPKVVPACCTQTYLPQLAPICSLTGQNVQPIPYILDCYLTRPNETCPFICNIDDFARYADYPAPQLES